VFFPVAKRSNGFIENNKYPIARQIYDQRYVVKKDLQEILNLNKWSIWSDDYNHTPVFTQMTENEIMSRISERSYINSTKKPAWRLFPLILNGKIIRNDDLCHNTLSILNNYKKHIVNAGFSLLEVGCHIGMHKDYDKSFYRLHIPLLIPKNNSNFDTFISESTAKNNNLAVLQVENDYRVWKEDDYFILDDTYDHDAWNNTDEPRVVLLVDIKR
jgi:aspartyl/asparaginyl beta-hydroxylase (cupin superfamily)